VDLGDDWNRALATKLYVSDDLMKYLQAL